MGVLRVVLAFLAAVVVTTILGAAFHTQFVIGRLSDLGIAVSFSDRLSTTLHDIGGMAPMFGMVIAIGFLVAFLAGALVYRFAGARRELIYVVAGAVAIAVALSAMAMVYSITPIAGARSWAGFAAQMLAGALGGYAFAMLSRARVA
ncbi:MAG: hypothetical protein KF895_01870 [Parvibaculum sp.]|nr:hypothetical protein [Parvibaculum sp.]